MGEIRESLTIPGAGLPASVILIWIASLAALPAPAAEGPDDSAASEGRKLLDRLAGVYLELETLRIDFMQTQDWVGMEDIPPWRGSLFLMRPDRFRIEYEEPAGHLQVGDGERVWTYVPENAEVLVTRVSDSGGTGGDLLRWILETGKPDPEAPGTTVRSRPALILTLRPAEGLGIEMVRIWVEPDGPGILQYEMLDSSGNRNLYRVVSLKPNEPIDPSLFRFQAPKGVPVVELGSP